ncbi:MAG: hypothetical protein Q8P48_04995, partial [Deltaproteobacteria bacterium]|nr:hypothetical protein [Deltaproteobacteria bacterium]
RFNWFDYQWPPPLQYQLNPYVTVRRRGVMEKCTFCIQRIRAAKDKAKDEQREMKDGDVQPACAQSCPPGAVTFGDLNDPESRVSKLAKSSRGYALLGELDTKPSVIYLKRVMKDGSAHGE